MAPITGGLARGAAPKSPLSFGRTFEQGNGARDPKWALWGPTQEEVAEWGSVRNENSPMM